MIGEARRAWGTQGWGGWKEGGSLRECPHLRGEIWGTRLICGGFFYVVDDPDLDRCLHGYKLESEFVGEILFDGRC